MLWGEESNISTGLWVGVGGVISGVIAAAVSIYNTIRLGRKEDRKDAIAQYQAIVERLDNDIIQHKQHANDLSKIVDQVSIELRNTQLEMMELYGQTEMLYDFAKRAASCCMKLGGDPGEIPPRPKRPERKGDSTEFRVRELKQRTELLSGGSSVTGNTNVPHSGI